MKKVKKFVTVLFIIGLLTLGTFTGFAQDQKKDTNQTRWEVTTARSSNTKTFRNADGTETMRFSYSPLHFKDENGVWQEIDNTIEENPSETDDDGQTFGYRVLKSPMKAYLPKRSNGWVRLSSGNSFLSYKLIGNIQLFGKRKKNQIRAANVLKNSDILYTFRGDALKEEIVLRSPDTPESFEFLFRLNNLTMAQNNNNDYIFTNHQGETQFVVPKFVMIDALGKTSTEIEVRIENQGGNTYRWTVTPNRRWLEAYDRAYPVILDPTTYKVTGNAQYNAGDNYYFFLYIPTDYPGQGEYNYNMGSHNGNRSLNNPGNITPKNYPVQVSYKAWAGDGGSDHGSRPGSAWTEYYPPFFRVTDWDPLNKKAATRSSARGAYLKRLEDGKNVYHTFSYSHIPGQYSGSFNIAANRAALVEMRSGLWTWWYWWSWGVDCGFEITYQNENISPPEPTLDLLPPETYGSSVILAWQAPTDEGNPGAVVGGIDRYYVQQSTDPNFTANVVTKDVGNATTYTFTGLILGTTYYYRVYCRDKDGNPLNMDPFNPVSNPSGVRWSRITRTKCISVPAAGGPDQPVISSLTPGNNMGQYYCPSRFPGIGWAYSSTQTAAQLAVVQYLTNPEAITEYPVIDINGPANSCDTTWDLPDGKYIVYLRTANSISWSPWSAGTIVTIDTVAPVISDVADENVYNTSDIQINFSTNEETVHDLYWGNSPDTIGFYSGGNEYESGERSETVYGGAYPLGADRYYQIKSRDRAGNEAVTPVYQVGTGTGSIVENDCPDYYGIESYWTYQDIDLGKAGTAKVNLNNGNLICIAMDFSLPGQGLPLNLVRYYNSLAEYSGVFGKGWRCNYEIYLELTGTDNRDIFIHDPDGSRHLFQFDAATGQFTRPAGDYRRVVKNSDGTYQAIEKSGTIYHFGVPTSGISRLVAIEDRFGNTMILTYTDGLLTSVQEPSGYRRVNFRYTTMGGKPYLQFVEFAPLEGSNPSRSIYYTYYANSLYRVYYSYNGTDQIKVFYDYDTFMGILISTKVSRTGNPSEVKNATSFAYKSCKRSIASISTSFDTYQENFVDYSYGPSVKTPVIYKFYYDGGVTKFTSPKSQEYTYSFNSGLLQSLKKPLCTYPISYTYDRDFNLLTTAQKKLVYDGAAETLRDVITESSYYPNGNLKTVTADKTGKNLTTIITYATSPRNVQTDIESITDPRGKTVNYINNYDPVTGKLTSLTIDPQDDYQITHTFNQYGERTDKDVILDSNPSVSKYHFGYGYLNGLLHTLSNKYGITTYEYTVYGERKKTIDANGVIQEYNINPSTGWVIAIPAPNTGTSTLKTYNAVGSRHIYSYDVNGNKTSEYDAKNHNTTYFYDALNRQYRVQSPYIAGLAQYNSYSRYDANGNLLAVRDYNGISTIYEYDGLNRRTRVKDYSGNIQEELTYDEADRVKTRYDGKGNLSVYYYDSVDNQVCTKYYEGGVYKYSVTCEYDQNGNLTRKTAPLSSGTSGETGELVTVYEYDASNRPTSIVTTCAGNSKYNQAITYTYEAGQLKTSTMRAADETPKMYTYSYDEAQRLDTLDDPFGQRVKFTYYPGGQRDTKVIYKQAGDPQPFMRAAYKYDAAYRLANLDYDWNSYYYRLDYQYNELDKIISNKVDYKLYAPGPGNFMASQAPGFFTYVWYELNNNGTEDTSDDYYDKKSQTYQAGLVESFQNSYTNSYKYDDLGRMTESVIRGIGGRLTIEPDYDSRSNPYRWYSVYNKTQFKTIDANGNPIDRATTNILDYTSNSHYDYDFLNRLKSSTEITSTNYDGNGNLTRETFKDNRPRDNGYSYGLDNQLIRNISETRHYTSQVCIDGETSYSVTCYNKTEKWYTYELGGKLLRVKSEVHDSTNPFYGWENNYNDYFYYSHDGAVAEYHADKGQYKYFTRLGGELLAGRDGGSNYFYIQNLRGDVVMLVKANGEVSSIREYDASGQMLGQAPHDRDPFGFTGGLGSGDGLWKLGARFYDSGKGSFIQQDRYLGDPSDPLSLNRYVYCNLDPVNFVDPTGFSGFPLPDWLNQGWRDFQAQVGAFNNAVRGTPLNGRIIDWVTSTGRAIEAKFVQNIQSTAQLQQFISDYGGKFELWISDHTQTISTKLLETIKSSGGKVVSLVNGVSQTLNIDALINAGGKVSDSSFFMIPDYMIDAMNYQINATRDTTDL